MKNLIGMMVGCLIITGCTQCVCYNNRMMGSSQYARCQELKKQILFITATNDSLEAVQLNAELDRLHREYQLNGC